MRRLALCLFVFSCSLSGMPQLAVLSFSVAGNMILLLASPATPGVHALHVASSPSRVHPNSQLDSTSTCRPLAPSSTSLASTELFGIHARRRRRMRNNQVRSMSSPSTPNGGSNEAVDAEITESSDEKTSTPSSSTSFLRAVDNFGMNLKPWALSAYERSSQYSSDVNGTVPDDGKKIRANKAKSILCKLQANILWMLYIFYRGYRGFFVILPAVFREVYRQLEESDLVVDVYGDEDEEEREYAVNSNAGESEGQRKEPMRLRTRITISVLSAMLTLSYVVSGLFRVLGKFIKTFTSTTSVESSLEAAADEVAVNEDKLRNKLT